MPVMASERNEEIALRSAVLLVASRRNYLS